MKKIRVILLLVICGFIIVSCKNTEKKEEKEVAKEEYMYNIRINDLNVERDTVHRNENLAGVLLNAGLTPQDVHTLVKQCDTIFDVRKFKKGNLYTKMYRDTVLAYFIYEVNIADYLVFDLSDSVYKVYKAQKEISYQERKASGVIESSLWNAMVDNSLDPNLAMQLSDIYAWTIDFFGLQKGDSFKVVFTEKYVDSISVGVESIKYALFNHMGQDCYAIPFEQDGIQQYFDENGNSIRKAFLKAPLKYSRISSHFSHARKHPVLKIVRPHHGVDYAAPAGTEVHTIGDGVVIKKGYSGGAGNMVTIKHNATYTTTYMHLSRFGKGISAGTRVRQGQIIGYVGSTGLSTGAHLDFRVYKNGVPINPLTMVSPPTNPVKKSDMPAFKHLSDSLVTILKSF